MTFTPRPLGPIAGALYWVDISLIEISEDLILLKSIVCIVYLPTVFNSKHPNKQLMWFQSTDRWKE